MPRGGIPKADVMAPARPAPREHTASDGSSKGTLAIRDRRTDQTYELSVEDGAIRATDLGQIVADGEQLMSYDPGLMNTATCRSGITFIDGDRGVLRYRGYPIEQLAGRTPFLDVAYLLIHGELPDAAASGAWAADVADQGSLPDAITELVATFPSHAHPMSVLLAAWSALGAYRPEAKQLDNTTKRLAEVPRFFSWVAAVMSLVFRHRTGRPLRTPAIDGDFATRLLGAMFPERGNTPDDRLTQAIDILLVLQADHEQNCSTNAVRAVGSSRVDPYSAFTAGLAALYGPLHGGANEAVLRMLHEIGTIDRIGSYVEGVKRGDRRLMGFGHRVYKNYDPRARIIRETAEQVFEATGRNPLIEVALETERIALADPYFIERRLYPNVDFYSGIIYEAMGMPVDTYTTLFAVARMAGWVAHWLELVDDPEQKIARPRQIYVGPGARDLL
jgi:citrate synthase